MELRLKELRLKPLSPPLPQEIVKEGKTAVSNATQAHRLRGSARSKSQDARFSLENCCLGVTEGNWRQLKRVMQLLCESTRLPFLVLRYIWQLKAPAHLIKFARPD